MSKMAMQLILLTTILAVLVPTFCQIPGECQTTNSSLYRYEVLPGIGWDNLKNENKGRVVQFTYSTCKITDDGAFLIPDGVYVVPMKSSNVEQFSQFIENVNNATSDVAVSINLDGTVAVDDIPINGKFSFEFQKMKSNMINDNSVALKVKAHYVMYNAKLQPNYILDPTFKSRVLSIANHLQLNRTSSARYESQLLVRDFGTHLATSVDAGASLVKIDHIKRSLLQDDSVDKFQISAAAAAEIIGVNVGVEIPADVKTKYLTAKTHSSIYTHGGPVYMPVNFTINDWVSQIDQNLVSVDRAGDPLNFVINQNSLPEVSLSVVAATAASIESAIKAYYRMNTHRGCTDRDSPNFSFFANVDDGSCEYNLTTTNFGGIFQTCNASGDINGICDNFVTKNPLTGDVSCPEGFDAVPLFRGQENKQEALRSCSSYMIFWKHCQTTSYYGSASYQSYWCAAREPELNSSGYMFGGLYTNQISNVVTQQKNCPQYFHAIRIADDLTVCVSDDFENGFKYSIPFNGFFSCEQGNPLASKENLTQCQAGFSQHLATIVNDCEINYCARLKPSGITYIPIRSPPFSKKPSDENTTSFHVVSEDGQSWIQIYSVPDNFSGFNGTDETWILDTGDFLDIHDLLMNRQKSNGDAPKTTQSFGSTEQYKGGKKPTHGRHGHSEDISSEQILSIVGGSIGITLSFVIFVFFVFYIFYQRKQRSTGKTCDNYIKMKA